MLPPEHRTHGVNKLQASLGALGGDLSKLESLTHEDFRIIGAYVQLYNFLEFNCRRAVEIFAGVGMLKGLAAEKPQRVHSSKLFETAKGVVARMDPTVEDVPDSLAKLDEIELRKGFRNLFAHWAARRIPGQDAIVLFSMDGYDERQISGADAPFRDSARTAMINLADIRGLLVHMSDYERWMGHKVAEWYARYPM